MESMTEVTGAVDAGQLVHWKNAAYTVIKSESGKYLVHHSNSTVGLFWVDGVTTSYTAGDFYVDHSTVVVCSECHKRYESADDFIGQSEAASAELLRGHYGWVDAIGYRECFVCSELQCGGSMARYAVLDR